MSFDCCLVCKSHISLLHLRRKKSKLAAADECPVALGDLENDVLCDSLVNKDHMQRKTEKLSTPGIDDINAKR